MMFRTGTGSPGSTLTAQQPDNNVIRVTLHTLAAVLGGAQALHTAAMDEALALPTEKSATLALRTQQVVAYESGAADVVDPLGGSYYVEALTDEIEDGANNYLQQIERMGGMLSAIASGWVQREIAESAYRRQREIEEGRLVVVGVNKFCVDEELPIQIHRPDADKIEKIRERLVEMKRTRDSSVASRCLARLRDEARGEGNLMPAVLEAVKAYSTVGEICDSLRGVFGEQKPPSF